MTTLLTSVVEDSLGRLRDSSLPFRRTNVFGYRFRILRSYSTLVSPPQSLKIR